MNVIKKLKTREEEIESLKSAIDRADKAAKVLVSKCHIYNRKVGFLR